MREETRWERFKRKLTMKLRHTFLPHYLIMGHFTEGPIGCTCGKRGIKHVLSEDPEVSFMRTRQRDCVICGKGSGWDE